MVFATTTRDLTVSAANRPRTTAQVEVCVIRTHHRPHQTVHFPYQIAICFLFFNSSLKNQDYSPETKLLCQQERSDDFFLSIIEKRWRKEWTSSRISNEKNWKSRMDFFLCRVYQWRSSRISKKRKTRTEIRSIIGDRVINSCLLLIWMILGSVGETEISRDIRKAFHGAWCAIIN